MKINFSNLLSNKAKKIEPAAIVIITILFIVFFRKIFGGQQIFSHDSIRWYGVYHFLADSLSNGIFPYWDPYDFSGQPFYYNLGILRLYEPITIAFIMLSKALNLSMLTTFHWEYMFRIWLTALGVYFCFRQFNKYMLSNLLIFGIFLFSSFTTTCLRQNGILYVFCWAPWALWFLLRLLKNFNFYNLIGFSFFVGISLSSYQGAYLLTYLFIFIATLLINHNHDLAKLLKQKKNILLIILGVILIALLSLPLWTVAIEQSKIVPTARLDDKASIHKGVNLDYGSIAKAGTHSDMADFLELIFPAAARGFFVSGFNGIINVSECFLYIGISTLILCFLGARVKSKYRLNFLLTLILTGLLMLGPKAGVHEILYIMFYPLRIARHMHLFAGFFIFTFFYFIGQGMDFVLDKLSKE